MTVDGIGRFERYSLQWARALLIGTIVLGCLAIVGGLLVAGISWLGPGPEQPVASPQPDPAKFQLEMAERWSAAHVTAARDLEQAALAVDTPGQIPTPLIPLLPSPPYASVDVWEDYCKVPSDYGCIQKGKRLKIPSAARTFSVLFGDLNEEDRNELVQVLAEHLPSLPIERRLGMVRPILTSFLELKVQNRKVLEAYEAKTRESQDSFSVEVGSHRDQQVALSLGGLWAALWGLGAVVSASLFVALLAIERHLRALRSTGQRASVPGGPSHPTPEKI